MTNKTKKRPMVVSRHGSYRFQTGMVTATLLRRGLEMDSAFAISEALRDSFKGRESVSTEELEAAMTALAVEQLGPDAFAEPAPNDTTDLLPRVPRVRTSSGALPFSRGILLRYLITAGLDPEPAMEIAQRVQKWLVKQSLPEVPEADVEAEVRRIVRERHGSGAARRYQLPGLIQKTDKPLIILIGGATGTGKSTLATELAFRLGIRLVSSTDMIRETMRTVLPASVVPGLHDHSFRGMFQDGQALSDPRERVLAGFRQQAAQVAVGIRAVIGRAIRERAHMIVEGTHLSPPFEKYLPPGADVFLSGVILAVPEEARHRARFPQRARRQTMRPPDAYLDAFQSVRWIHDDLLSAAEEVGCVVLANAELDQSVTSVVEFLSRSLPLGELGGRPRPARPPVEREGPDVPTLFLILDGLSDEPNDALGGKTPLEAAQIPTLRTLAATGGQGLIQTGGAEGVAPETDEGLLALLGVRKSEPTQRLGRGLLEALGHGLPLPAGAIVFRGNLATVQRDGMLADRRAGRIRAGMEDLLADLRNVDLGAGLTGHIFPGHEHRVVVMLQGQGLSDAVSDTDPGGDAALHTILAPHPIDGSPEASRTAEALRRLLEKAHEHLDEHPFNKRRRDSGLFPANCVITRGAAAVDSRPKAVAGATRTALISGCSTALGVARAVGLQPASTPLMTGNLDTDLEEKFRAAASLLSERPFVALHIKGTDIAAHDRKPLEKRDFISSVDAALGRFLSEHAELAAGLRIVVSADHGTSSVTGNHLTDPVPVLVARWNGPGEQEDFHEESAGRGALGLLQPGELAEMLWAG